MDQYIPAVAAGACGLAAFAFGGRLLRPRFPVRVNCWFCDKNSIVPYGNRNCWDCPHCDQYNGFDEDGNYNKDIPAQFSEGLNSLTGGASSPDVSESQQQHRQPSVANSFCADCNRNQLIKIKQLAAFTPLNEDTFDEEVDLFKKRLDVSLALCGSCQAKAESVIDQQNRSLMYDIAADAIFKTTRQPEDENACYEIEDRRRRRYRRAALLLNIILIGVTFSLCLALYSRHFRDIAGKLPFAPEPTFFTRFHASRDFLAGVWSRSLALVFVGVFFALASVSLKNEARVYVGYLDLAVVMSWLAWLVAKLIVDHAFRLPSSKIAPSQGKMYWMAKRIETVVYPSIVGFAAVSTFLNFIAISFQKSKCWRPVKKISRGSTSSHKITTTLKSLHSYGTPPPHYATPAFSPASSDTTPMTTPPPTSTPPLPTSRPPSPAGSIVGQGGQELRMGDIAGMTLSTGLTPKKKTQQRGAGRGGSALFSAGSGPSVWGNVGLNCSLSSSASSLDKQKPKSIISPARFTGSVPRNTLPGALFGSSATSNISILGNLPLGNSSRPSSPPGWGRRDSLGGGLNAVADDALSTVSAPSRFAAPSGGGLFAGFSPQPSQATTPRGSDNTSNSEHDWPPTLVTTNLIPANLTNSMAATRMSPSSGNGIDDTFTDDSESDGCLADATMKGVDKPLYYAQQFGRGRRRKTPREPRQDDGGGHFMKIVAVFSVVANVVLAFYLGTMMKS